MKEKIVMELVEEVKKVAGERYTVTLQGVKKNNGVELLAVYIRSSFEVITPAVYIDKTVKEIEREEITIMEAAQKIFDTYQERKDIDFGIEAAKLMDKQFILNHVEYQVVNAKRNVERLEGVPRKQIVDLAVIYRAVPNDGDNGLISYILNENHLKLAGINADELDEAARSNTQKAGFVIKTMGEIMAEMMGMNNSLDEETLGGPQMYVLTNRRKVNGANILLYKDRLAEVANRLKDDFFILPSSIHELLAVPVSGTDVKELRAMVKEVNNTEVAPEEILSYEVYRYSRKTCEIEVTA